MVFYESCCGMDGEDASFIAEKMDAILVNRCLCCFENQDRKLAITWVTRWHNGAYLADLYNTGRWDWLDVIFFKFELQTEEIPLNTFVFIFRHRVDIKQFEKYFNPGIMLVVKSAMDHLPHFMENIERRRYYITDVPPTVSLAF